MRYMVLVCDRKGREWGITFLVGGGGGGNGFTTDKIGTEQSVKQGDGL